MSAVVGIDVGAYKHAAAVCRSGEREAERGVFRLSADRAGFDELDRWLERQGPVERVVLESSGHYYWPLASHLHRHGYGVAVVNPLQVKYFAKSRLQRSKSDPADARTLAAMGMSEEPRVKDPLLGAEAKEAARFWGGLVKEQAQVRQKLLRLVEIGFPELKECFEDPLCETALAVLREAPTARVASRKRVSTLADTTRPGDRRRLGENKARRLHELAERTVAPPELDAQMSFEVGMLIQQFDLLDKQIEIAEQRVAEVLDSELARRLQTIPGVGPALAASFIAEIGDIWRFDDFDQLASYAGVHPKELSSGTKGQNPETSWRMAKTGKAYLRSAALTVASCGDTLTEIRYTTLKDATTRLLQPPVFVSVSESVWEKGLPYTCKSVFCSYFSVFPDSVKVTLNACVRSFVTMYWVSATPSLWVLSVIVVPGAPSATTQTPRGMQNVS
jgi:transposase